MAARRRGFATSWLVGVEPARKRPLPVGGLVSMASSSDSATSKVLSSSMRFAAEISDMGLSWSAASSPSIPGAIEGFSRQGHDAEQQRSRRFSEVFAMKISRNPKGK